MSSIRLPPLSWFQAITSQQQGQTVQSQAGKLRANKLRNDNRYGWKTKLASLNRKSPTRWLSTPVSREVKTKSYINPGSNAGRASIVEIQIFQGHGPYRSFSSLWPVILRKSYQLNQGPSATFQRLSKGDLFERFPSSGQVLCYNSTFPLDKTALLILCRLSEAWERTLPICSCFHQFHREPPIWPRWYEKPPKPCQRV